MDGFAYQVVLLDRNDLIPPVTVQDEYYRFFLAPHLSIHIDFKTKVATVFNLNVAGVKDGTQFACQY